MRGHLIALTGKRPLQRGWERRPWDGTQLSGQDGVGIIPWSIGCVVVDVDDPAGEQVALDALGEPIASQRTPSGGVHLIYRADHPHANRKWLHGDIRGGSGYVRVYDDAAWDKAAAFRHVSKAAPVGRLSRPSSQPRRTVRRAARPVLPSQCSRGCDGGCWACNGRVRDIPPVRHHIAA